MRTISKSSLRAPHSGQVQFIGTSAQRVPAAAQAWLGRLRNVNQEQVWAILERVPAKRMTKMSKQFTAELLRTNRQRLEE